MDNKEIRRANMLMLVEQFGSIRKLADAVDTPASHLSNIKNRVKTAGGERNIGDDLARKFEEKLGKLRGWMDTLHASNDVEDDEIEFSTARVPVVGTAQLGPEGFWDETGYPTGHGEGFVAYPTRDKNSYALRVKGDSMRPRIQPGEYVVILPNHAVTPGAEVLVKTKDGRSMIKKLGARRGGMVELLSVNDTDFPPITLDEADIEKIHYMVAIVKDDLYRMSTL